MTSLFAVTIGVQVFGVYTSICLKIHTIFSGLKVCLKG